MIQLFKKMISRPVVALIGAATVVVLIYAGITVLFSTKTKTLSSPYVWDDCKSTYTIHVESKTGYGQSRKHTTLTMEISGRLHARPLKFSNGYRVVMEFDPVVVVINGQHSSSLESVLQSVFFVDMNSRGTMKGFGFPGVYSDDEKDFVIGILRSFDTSLHNEGKKIYTDRHNDGLGTYFASYTREEDYYHKKKLHYQKSKNNNPDNSLSVKVLQSDITIKPDSHGCWINEMQGTERLKVSVFNKTYQSITSTSFQLIKENGFSGSKISHVNDLADLKSVMNNFKRSGAIQNNKGPVTFEAVDLLIKKIDNEPARKTVLELRKLLSAHPELIDQLPDSLLWGSLKDSTVSEFIKSLGIIGLPEAQEALVTIASDENFSNENRFRAIMSFAELQQPLSDDASNYLLSQLDNISAGSANTEISSSAILVVGAIANNLQDSHPENAQGINNNIKKLLSESENSEQERILLTALGNSRLDENVSLLDSYCDSTNMGVKIAAINALGKYNNEEATKALVDAVENDQEDLVLMAILKGLQGKEIKTDSLEKIGDLLLISENEEIRRNAIPVLEMNLKENPEKIKAILKEAMENETSRQNMHRLIKAYNR